MTIIIIVAILLIIGGVFVYLYETNNVQVKKITKQLDDIDDLNLVDIIDQISDIKLTGSSSDTFEKNKHEFNDVQDELSLIQTRVIVASEQNSQFHIWQSRRALQTINKNVNEQSKKARKVSDNLNNLLNSIRQNEDDEKQLNKKSEILQSDLTENKEAYGTAAPKLQNQLNDLANDFEDVHKLINEGDALKARYLLKSLQTKIKKYQQNAKGAKKRGTGLEENYSDQIDELRKANLRMHKEGYNFNDPQIDTELKEIDNLISKSKDKLAELNFSDFDLINQKIKGKIQYLYDRVEKEWRARKKVKKLRDTLFRFISHARKQNHVLSKNIEKMSSDYVISHYDREYAQLAEGKIDFVEKNFQKRNNEIKSERAIYSNIAQDFQIDIQKLTGIETKQKKIEDTLDGLIQDRNVAVDNLKKYDVQLDQDKRRIEVLHLNGLPKKYNQEFNMVIKETNKIRTMLEEPPVDVEELTKQMFVAQEDLSNFENTTDQLIHDVNLTGSLLQYANRYIDTVPEVKVAVNKTMKLYDKKFDYANAVKTISQALDAAEPGSVKRINESSH